MDQIITSTLKTRRQRSLGLRLLICYLKKSNVKLEENVNTWTSLLIQSCKLPELRLYGDLIFSAMALLIDRLQSDGNMSKAFASAHLYKVIECLSHNEIYKNERQTFAALHTIKKCLKYYPKGTKAKSSTIKNILALLIDNRNDDVVYQSGECWLLLHKLHGISEKEHIGNIIEWKDFQLSLLSNIQYIINSTIVMNSQECVESLSKPNNFWAFTFEAVKDPFERATQAFRRIFNLIEYLKIALRKQFFKKYICIHQILVLIQNGLKAHVKKQHNLRIDHAYIETFLPQMHMKFLELLEIVIETCYTHLRMDYRLVLNILLDGLEKKRKSMFLEANSKEVLNMRVVVYRVISLWCSTLQEGSHCEIIEDTLIKELLGDMLSRVPTSIKNESGPHLKQSPETLFSMLKFSLCNEDYDELRQQAHSCLQKFLLSSGHLIKQQLLKEVHNTLLGISVQMHSHPTKEPKNKELNGRLEVYMSFTILLKLRNYRCPTPSEIIMTLLHESRLFNDSIQLKQSHSLNFLELMLHPQKADIHFKSVDNLRSIPLRHTNFSTNQTKNGNDLLQTVNSAKDPLMTTFTTIENNEDNQKDKSSLSKEKPFEVVSKNYLKELIAEEKTKNIKEISDDPLISSKCNSLENLEEQTHGIMNGTNLNSDLISSCFSAKNTVKIIPSNLKKLDDAEMIADLEAIFVSELL
ncbi:uncharacterized protein LOC120448286 isoform X1 [Drosophila santomea]|uniref:uncharacterized protein LOC120448286 isoform X1 n=2 Tax=Drosophila santomea TaxID=129105 RepID=UPI001CD02883|nr:uncharacterized protein LOC120448286 isoform X1 [Drosophila santomea]XP_039486152.2 uncharacterized protein LOC120448286 isoform X1 [Drosophila santomea]